MLDTTVDWYRRSVEETLPDLEENNCRNCACSADQNSALFKICPSSGFISWSPIALNITVAMSSNDMNPSDSTCETDDLWRKVKRTQDFAPMWII